MIPNLMKSIKKSKKVKLVFVYRSDGSTDVEADTRAVDLEDEKGPEKVSRAPREPRRTRTSSIVEVETPKKTNPMEKSKTLKKLVFRTVLVAGTDEVAQRKAKELPNYRSDGDLVGENILPMLKTKCPNCFELGSATF